MTSQLQRHDLESELLPSELQRALRAARTPLIEGVDFKAASGQRDAILPDPSPVESFPLEKSRVDTLSPKESVPPPAPFPAEPPPPRPSVVPPVRRPYGEPQLPRARSDGYSTGLRSDPPPRIPISDRPSRPAYSSDPPPRVSRSDPPPQSSGRGTGLRRSWSDGLYAAQDVPVESAEARRREAVTIPADAHSPSQAPPYDPSVPLPALRAPSFPGSHLPASIRQHENSRLRNVLMAMMFVIAIVAGAIAGMRWYVARDEGAPTDPNVAETSGQRVPKLRLDRLEPNAVVAPKSAQLAQPAQSEAPPAEAPDTRRAAPNSTNEAQKVPNAADGVQAPSSDPLSVESPWSRKPDTADTAASATPPTKTEKATRAGTNRRSTQKAKARVLDPKQVDTKTPLIMD